MTLSLVGTLDKIKTDGKKAIGDLLTKLNCYKALADVESAKKLWDDLTSLDADWESYRALVLKKKKPRPVYVQPATRFKNFPQYML